MAHDAVSRESGPTLADVLAIVLGASELPCRRRDDLASALRAVGRLLGLPLDRIPANASQLTKLLAEAAPLSKGVSRSRLRNVYSLVKAALAMTRGALPKRTVTPLSAEWDALWRQLPRFLQYRISRALRYLSARNIAPGIVGMTDFEAYAVVLKETNLPNIADRKWREVVSAWNFARKTVLGWPDIELHIEPKRKPYTFKWDRFTAALKQDADLYLARIAGNDLVADLPFKPVSLATRKFREFQILCIASALVHRGKDPATLNSMADLVAFDNFVEGLRFFVDRQGGKPAVASMQLAIFLKSVAKHWVKIGEPTLERMKAVIRRLSPPQRDLTQKNRDRLRQLEDPDKVIALVNLPFRLMEIADSVDLPPVQSALMAQLAVAIELLLFAPVRSKNLASIDIEKHLVRPRPDIMYLVFDETEVKNTIYLDIPLPEESIALIDHYLKQHRPVLTGVTTGALFPGERGCKGRNTLAIQIKKVVFEHTGLTVNAHLFRHICGMLHLNRHPGEHAIIARVLGHRSINTTLRYYTGLETRAAVKRFHETIRKLRKKGKDGKEPP
jgi:integrase